MALASALVALITLPLADAFNSPAVAVRIASVVALVFTAVHVGILVRRIRTARIAYRGINWALASAIDTGLLVAGVLAVVLATAPSYEWLLVFMTARPAVAFVMALTDVN